MQALRLKKSLFWLVCTVFSFRVQADSAFLIRQADSLFAVGQKQQAVERYERALAEGYPASDVLLLKLASAYDIQNNPARQLFYLQAYYNRHPDEGVNQRIHELVRANGLGGYEPDELSYLALFYHTYRLYVQWLLLTLTGYFFWLTYQQKKQNQTLSVRRIVGLAGLLLLLLGIVNLPDSVPLGITATDRVMLRTAPSSAASVAQVLGKGNRLTLFGRSDIYYRVRWQGAWYYVRQDAVWRV